MELRATAGRPYASSRLAEGFIRRMPGGLRAAGSTTRFLRIVVNVFPTLAHRPGIVNLRGNPWPNDTPR